MKFFKNFFNYLKRLLKKQDKEINKIDKLINQDDSFDENLYSQIVVGDIIWAKRYENQKEKELIPEGHREGPYIVLKKQDGKLICTQGTSVVPYKEQYEDYFALSNIGYSLFKETFFKLYQIDIVNNHQIIKILDRLNEKDKNKLFKHIKQLHKNYYTKHGTFIKLDLPIQVGDIVNFNSQTFIVIDVNKNNIICIFLKNHINYKKDSQLEYINFQNLDYSKSICLELNKEIKYVNTVNNKIIKSILNGWHEYINNCKNIEVTQRGSIVLKDEKYYYIYGEEGKEWLAFEISKKYNQNLDKIQMGKDVYYTKYDDIKINKKENFTNIYLCTEKEKDNIKQLRKNYKETKKHIDTYGTAEFVYFNIGDIIENINYKGNRYIIIGVKKKTYECLSINDLKKAIYNPILIRKTDSKISKNLSVSGIKWLEEHKNFNLKRIANKDVLEQILTSQAQYIKVQNKKEDTNYINLNTRVKTNEFSEETFVVKEILGDMLVCVSTIDLGVRNPKKNYFNKNNVIIVKEKQKRK